VNRTFDLPQQPGQGGVGPGLAAEESHLDAVGEPLVDQHGDVLASLQGLREPQGRLAASRDQRAHLHLAHLFNDAVR